MNAMACTGLVLFGLYAWLGSGHWAVWELLAGGLAALAAGAVAGVALFIALVILKWSLIIAAVALCIGFGLHLLGAVNHFALASRFL